MWSLGVILLELFMGQHLFPDLSFPNGLTVMLQRVMRTVHNYQSEEGERGGGAVGEMLKAMREECHPFPSCRELHPSP